MQVGMCGLWVAGWLQPSEDDVIQLAPSPEASATPSDAFVQNPLNITTGNPSGQHSGSERQITALKLAWAHPDSTQADTEPHQEPRTDAQHLPQDVSTHSTVDVI
jgi:hypothetical protein